MLAARTSLATLVATAAVALGAIGLAVAAPGGAHGADLQLRSAAGAVAFSGNREGEAIFSATGLRPGQAVGGTLVLANGGKGPAGLTLRATDVMDIPGPGGGRLSERVTLTITDTTPGRAATELWAGTPAALAGAGLGQLDAGGQRRFAVTAVLPHSGADNAYQGAALELGLQWNVTAHLAPPVSTPTPPAPPVPAPPVPAPPAPAPPVPAPPAGAAVLSPPPVGSTPGAGPVETVAAEELGLPSAKRCLSRRKFVIHVRAPRRRTVARATVKVGRKAAVRIAGRGRKKVAARVSLRGMSGSKVVVRIEVLAGNGRRYGSARAYKICAGR
jgi:hypothetical protein